MSASTERKIRAEAIANGTDRKSKALLEEEKKRKTSKAKWTVGTIIVAILVIFILVLNSNLFYTGTTAVTIGDETFSTAQFNYYYKTQYLNFAQNYSSYLSYIGLDTQKSLRDQECGMSEEAETWFDYFEQSALDVMTQVVAMEKYAKDNGITLDDADMAEVDSTMADFASAAENYGYLNTKNYLIALFGKGCTEEMVRNEVIRQTLATKAYNTVLNDYADSLSDADLEACYTENKDSFDVFDYDYYLVQAEKVEVAAEATEATGTDAEEAAEPTTEVTDETMAAAKETADKIAEAAKEGTLEEAVTAEIADASVTSQTNITGSNVSSLYSEWIQDASRVPGDVTVVESSGSGYYVVKFVGRDDNHYQMASVRHILIKAVADDNGEYTDEAKQTAKEKVEDIFTQWQNGVATEESFASFAGEYSEDTGSKDNGGLYESIHKGQMVKEFNDFCFAEGRQTGDTDIIYGEASGSYAGYHAVYFVGYGDLYSNYLANNKLSSDYMNNWTEELFANYTATTSAFTMKFAG